MNKIVKSKKTEPKTKLYILTILTILGIIAGWLLPLPVSKIKDNETTLLASSAFIPSPTITAAPGNQCAFIRWPRPLSIRALPSLYVPALGVYNAYTIVIIDGVITVNNVNDPRTVPNESIDSGVWARINRGNYIPIKLGNTIYARVEPCNLVLGD